ncbi:MAG: hypothetical protein LUQ33_03550 [Methanoregulaceae archaeon]|jgi:PKD repeat protein|nr:hypothetical protein [Methanoregulaceae archaeon]
MKRYTRYLLLGVVIVSALISQCSAGSACPFGSSGGSGYAGGGEISPFDGSGAGGMPDPFPDVSDASGIPCPFDGSGAGGMPDPFPDVSDASGIPCPFSPDSSSPQGSEMTAVGETAQYPAPGDPDGDGLYEDLNGNGHIDFADLILYFNNMDWIREKQPINCFDYNSNGNIDFADLIFLFQEV